MASRFLETIKEEDPRFETGFNYRFCKYRFYRFFEHGMIMWLLRSRASKPSSEIVYAAEQGDIDRVERILKIMPHMANRKASEYNITGGIWNWHTKFVEEALNNQDLSNNTTQNVL